MIARIAPSELREKMILRMPVEVRMPSGTVKDAWQDVDDAVWTGIKPMKPYELFYAQQLAPLSNVYATIRYRDDVVAGWGLFDETGRYKYIIQAAPRDVEFRHTLLMLFCQMLQVGGTIS